MEKFALSALCLGILMSGCGHGSIESRLVTQSPEGEVSIRLEASADSCGHVYFVCGVDGSTVMDSVALGLRTQSADYSSLKLVGASDSESVVEDYVMLTGKRSHCKNEANQRIYTFVNADSDSLMLTLRVFHDGMAFRYGLPDASAGDSIIEECTSYSIKYGMNRWAQSYDPGYERFYDPAADGRPSNWGRRESNKWGYPMLVEPKDSLFMLITEAGLKRGHCASLLDNSRDSQSYQVALGDDKEACPAGWFSPWRVVIMGSLADVVESTLVTDVSEPSKVADTGWIQPGPASWIYWAHNHGSKDYKIVTEYIDLAADMGWPYVLIDWEWSEMSNGGDIDDALAYAKSKGVKPLLWYNSSTSWIGPGSPTPLYRLNEKDNRVNEYKMLHDKGAYGVKIDFFEGDQARTINYYIDLLEDAVDHQQLVTFHGATIPRGWQRTYPHLMTVEGVYGAEWYNNGPWLAPVAARHNATLPFTRNVVGPMDYTPGTFSDSQNPHFTTHGHELALYLLFESAVQHMPDRPSTYKALPAPVKALLSELPTTWTDTRLLSGYPGKDVVMARNKDGKWYVAGINGEDEAKTITVDLSKLNTDAKQMTIFADGASQTEFDIRENVPLQESVAIECAPKGGFVISL